MEVPSKEISEYYQQLNNLTASTDISKDSFVYYFNKGIDLLDLDNDKLANLLNTNKVNVTKWKRGDKTSKDKRWSILNKLQSFALGRIQKDGWAKQLIPVLKENLTIITSHDTDPYTWADEIKIELRLGDEVISYDYITIQKGES